MINQLMFTWYHEWMTKYDDGEDLDDNNDSKSQGGSPCCIYPGSSHAAPQIAPSWSPSQDEAPGNEIYICGVIRPLILSLQLLYLFLYGVPKATVVPCDINYIDSDISDLLPDKFDSRKKLDKSPESSTIELFFRKGKPVTLRLLLELFEPPIADRWYTITQ